MASVAFLNGFQVEPKFILFVWLTVFSWKISLAVERKPYIKRQYVQRVHTKSCVMNPAKLVVSRVRRLTVIGIRPAVCVIKIKFLKLPPGAEILVSIDQVGYR